TRPINADVPIHPSACPARTALSRRPRLPADAEPQEIRPSEQTHVTPGVVESQLEIPAGVREPAAHRDPLAGEAPGFLAGREGAEVDVIVVVGRLQAVTAPRREHVPRVVQGGGQDARGGPCTLLL